MGFDRCFSNLSSSLCSWGTRGPTVCSVLGQVHQGTRVTGIHFGDSVYILVCRECSGKGWWTLKFGGY